ncbi:MAG: hypothetical protein KDB80_04010 [Planctomycetes bacterium]|nr:hypothetical protein [Planctomycetota bacterium]
MRRTHLALGLAAIAAATGSALLTGCSAHPRRDPTGEEFPSVRATRLDGSELELPAAGRGEPLLLLVGFEQDAQFDLDRWLLGLAQAGVEVRAFEVPTIPGLIPGMISGTIDSGMRRGIPEEDWGAVATVYDDADRIARFTGNEDGLTGRILLLDRDGRVVFFHDRGYSVGTLRRLQVALTELRNG